MPKPFGDLIKDWPQERKARVEARAKVLIAEEMTLRDLRKAQKRTQVQLAKKLGIGQEQVSRLEKKSDMLLSTLANYVRAMGGDLKLTAEFPDRPPVKLSNLSDVFGRPQKLEKPLRRRRKTSTRPVA
jgi:transcriptional regulator with XRE-family HTH domain